MLCTGIIDRIYPTKNFDTKNGPSCTRAFVLKVEGKKTNYLEMTLFGEMVTTFDNFRLGDNVLVNYDVSGRYGSGSYSERVFMNLYVSEIKLHVERAESVSKEPTTINLTVEEEDDLPF